MDIIMLVRKEVVLRTIQEHQIFRIPHIILHQVRVSQKFVQVVEVAHMTDEIAMPGGNVVINVDDKTILQKFVDLSPIFI